MKRSSIPPFYSWKSDQSFSNFYIKGMGEIAVWSLFFSCPCTREEEIWSSWLEYPIWI